MGQGSEKILLWDETGGERSFLKLVTTETFF